MGQVYKTQLSGSRVFCCKNCKTHLTTGENLVSKAFQGQYGQAYLFRNVENIIKMDEIEREMTTGLHKVQDVKCTECLEVLGWHYVKAYEDDQRYKEGMTILEKYRIV